MEHTPTITQPNDENIPQRKDVYQQVTDTIIKQLEAGTVPWKQSWTSKAISLPKNAVTGNTYRGINIVLLWSASADKNFTSQEWASFKQWSQQKESVRKGEKGNLIVFKDSFEKEVDGEMKRIPFLKSSVVFNRCQLNSFDPAKEEVRELPNLTLVEKQDKIEDFIGNTFAAIEHHEGDAFYNVSNDTISMPVQHSFINTPDCSATENYYSVLLHELTHWTAHPSRLNRQIRNKFGSDAYAEEELVAELGASFLSSEFELSTPKNTSHASYIANWLRVLKDNKQFIISAASEAGKAVDYLRELQPLKLTL